MSEHDDGGFGFGMVIAAVVLVVLMGLGAVFFLSAAPMPASSGPPLAPSVVSVSSGPPASRASSSLRGMDFVATPLRVSDGVDGPITVRVEIARQGEWNWDSVRVKDVKVVSTSGGGATLVTPAPTAPVPEKFVLEFECDKGVAPEPGATLRFSLDVKISKYLGTASGSFSHSVLVPLKPTAGEGRAEADANPAP